MVLCRRLEWDHRMAVLFWIIVILLLILTGAALPILYLGLWAVLVILILVFLGWMILKAFGLIIHPFALIGSDVVNAIRGDGFPKPNDPDYKAYIDWSNQTGEFYRYAEWGQVKNILNERRRSDAEREAWIRKIERQQRQDDERSKCRRN
jgi:hypothetical protein